ncbi:MAG: hypothetical protein KatS3mg095_0442 [Candidatus Parcubacteria bacterium]|nr:MAG: hypothetical protein KatS3mg095_0442 [Candidatus Parcubacteria bacterium]
MTTKSIQNYIKKHIVNPKERLNIWLKVAGIWAKRKPDPIKELRKIRKSLERF